MVTTFKRAPCMADLRYLGTIKGPTRGAFGDPQLGNGLAVHVLEDGTIRLYAASFNPVQILTADVRALGTPEAPAAPAWRAIGTLPCTWSKSWGVFYDHADPAIYLTCHSDYDGDAPTAATLSRGRFNETGGLVADGQWMFENRSDKMTDGGVTALPDGRLAVGFGGYRSVVATGPASMGAALAAFDRPTAPGPIPCTPILHYPYSKNVVPRMYRPLGYVNDIGGDAAYPYEPTEWPGYTTWADWSQQSGTWIETDRLSGLLMIWQRATGRVWYTNTINAEGWQYDLVCYGAEILEGGAPDSYQPAVDEPFEAPGLPPTGQHADTPGHVVCGVTYDTAARILVVGVQGMYGTDAASLATGYLVFAVDEGGPTPPDERPYLVTRATVEQQTITAADADAAIDAAEATPDAWTIVSTSASATARAVLGRGGEHEVGRPGRR